MGSESEEILTIEDSDDSLLDIGELNDAEFDIPPMEPPSLESVLWEMESEEGSDSASLHSFQSLTAKFRSMLYHCILQGLSTQITSAGERVGAGLPTVITNSIKYIAVGTSHGYVLSFDTEQNLCWCCYDTNSSDQGAVSALAFNLDSTRLLVGYERGFISMVDASSGDVIRRMPDAHAPQTAVLHLRFTFLNNLALCGDSSGCVFSLTFNKRLGVRLWNSKCLFSGARGEVCVFEPLVQGYDLNFLNHYVVVAMATLSKIIVITIRPRLKVLFSQQLPRISTSLPLVSWQIVSIGKTFQPVLTWGRSNILNYTRLIYQKHPQKFRLIPLRNVQLPYELLSIHWLGQRHLALLDINENLHLIDVKSQQELEFFELSNVDLCYNSAHFKALALGGGVSEAFSLAGERACYNSLSGRGQQLLILGRRNVFLIKLRTWIERLNYLCEQNKWTEALNLATNDGFTNSKEKFVTNLLFKYLENLNRNTVDKDSLTAAVDCCVKLEKTDILCNELLEAVSIDDSNQDWYYTLLVNHIINGKLKYLTPSLTQNLVNYLANPNLSTRDLELLENVLLNLDLHCLDLHQVLNICKKEKLYTSWIHITTKTMNDYTSPLTEFLNDLTPNNHRLGNVMLVYVSSCLSGLGYPNGQIAKTDVSRVKYDILRCLETMNAVQNHNNYPYLRALLKYNIRDFLNVLKLAFNEIEFSGEMGLLQRQRLIDILLQIVVKPEFTDSEIINLSCFITRLLITNNLNLEEITLRKVIKTITNVKNNEINLRDHMEREQAWLDLLNKNLIINETIEKQLEIALKTNCFCVAEYLCEKLGNYENILKCYLNDPIRKTDVFNYIINNINNNERLIKQQFLLNFQLILEIDAKKTANIILNYFPNLLEEFYNKLDNDNLKYNLLHSIVVNNDFKLPENLSIIYLELLCEKNIDFIESFLKNGLYPIEKALEIMKKHEIYTATALLLEKNGEWLEALNLLLNYNNIHEALLLCCRGSEHLDNNNAQKLWLNLLKFNKENSVESLSLRQLLHAAAPYVPPQQLLELVSNASFGDVKVLLKGMLMDCKYDVEMLKITLRLLGKDLHYGLVKSLSQCGRAVCVGNTICKLCQKSLTVKNNEEQGQLIAIWGCGHCFHKNCVKDMDENSCPQCRFKAIEIPIINNNSKKIIDYKIRNNSVRPDLEGHF